MLSPLMYAGRGAQEEKEKAQKVDWRIVELCPFFLFPPTSPIPLYICTDAQTLLGNYIRSMNFVMSLIFGWYCSNYAKPICAAYTVHHRATASKIVCTWNSACGERIQPPSRASRDTRTPRLDLVAPRRVGEPRRTVIYQSPWVVSTPSISPPWG